MSLPAKAENVAVVRHAIAGLAERIGMDEASTADLKTVVTEACMNVVVHAYPEGETGLLEVDAMPDGDGLTVAVRDFGRGISPRPGVDRPEPADRPGADRGALLQLRDPRRGGAGDRDPHAPAADRRGRSPRASVAPPRRARRSPRRPS